MDKVNENCNGLLASGQDEVPQQTALQKKQLKRPGLGIEGKCPKIN